MKPWGRSKSRAINREFLVGEWLDLGDSHCTRCGEERRCYAPVCVQMLLVVSRVMEFLLDKRVNFNLPDIAVCADCSRVYACTSYGDELRYNEECESENEGLAVTFDLGKTNRAA